MSILPAGYIPQLKETSASSSGSLGFIRMVYQNGRLSPTNWLIQSDHLLIADYDDTAFGAGTLTCTFLESRSIIVENLAEAYYYQTNKKIFLVLCNNVFR
jgi:hypothetical protein